LAFEVGLFTIYGLSVDFNLAFSVFGISIVVWRFQFCRFELGFWSRAFYPIWALGRISLGLFLCLGFYYSFAF
jgi:hypothetical protein